MADMGSLAGFSDGLAGLVETAGASVVAVTGHKTRASGFVWASGWVVTADEALAEGDAYTVSFTQGPQVAATLHGRDPSTDVALLKLASLEGVPAVMGGAARTGGLVLALGAAEAGLLAAFGAITHAGPAWQSMRGGQIDARIDLGLRLDRRAEGGLALDMTGRAIGMNAFGARHAAIVIPAATIQRVAAQLQSQGRIARGYLGVGLQPVAVAGQDYPGGIVISVDADGPAGKAGIHQGDIVVALDGAALTRVQHLSARLGPETVGKAMVLGLIRSGAALSVTVTVGERPAA